MIKKVKEALGDRVFMIVCIVITALWIFALLVPMYWLVISSMKDPVDINRNPPSFIPTIPNEYYISVEASGDDYTDEDFKMDSLSLIWYSFTNVTDIHCTKIIINQIQNGKIVRSANFTSADYTTNRYLIFYGNITEKLIRGSKFEKLDALMSETNGFNFDVDKKASSIGKSTDLSEEFFDYLVSITDESYADQFESDDYRLQECGLTISGVTAKKTLLGMFANFGKAWNYFAKDNLTFFDFMKNSIVITFATIILQWVVSGFAGFALSKVLSKRASNYLQMFYILPMLIPSVVTTLPLYIMVSSMGLLNNLLAVILPTIGNTVSIILFRGFFDNIPKELYEAAAVDGANAFTIFGRIFLPISYSVFGVIAIMTFVTSWNDFMWPFMVLKEKPVMTFPIIISSMMDGTSGGAVDYPTSLAMSVLASIPTFILFAFFQKQVSAGLVFSGIKG